jgi:hypothetical protein
MKKPSIQHIKSVNRFSKTQAGIFALVFAEIGGYIIYSSFAAGFIASFEAENSTVNSPAATVADAGASGGSALKFQATGSSCPTGQVGTPPNCFSTPPAPLSAGKHWTVPFTEEFNGTDYDHNKLTPCFDWNFGDCTSTFNNGYEHYEPSAITVNNGIGNLNATPLTNTASPPACGIATTTKCSGSACLNSLCIYK